MKGAEELIHSPNFLVGSLVFLFVTAMAVTLWPKNRPAHTGDPLDEIREDAGKPQRE